MSDLLVLEIGISLQFESARRPYSALPYLAFPSLFRLTDLGSGTRTGSRNSGRLMYCPILAHYYFHFSRT